MRFFHLALWGHVWMLAGMVFLANAGEFKLGIEALEEQGFAPLSGKKIGLVANPASVTSSLTSSVDVFRRTDRCRLTALFGPEHGAFGSEHAGGKVQSGVEAATALPIHSLYGKTRKPTPEMLKGLDALVFDLQDIGSRSYTYISTMKLCLEACAEAGIEFVVLDRPNPLGGVRVEGPMVEKPFESFISALSVPYLHGMTMGELAKWTRDELQPHYSKLTVAAMKGWKRADGWRGTGLRWTPTSPHIPQSMHCAYYAATGILGELGQVSNGVGYPQPFELIGAPWINGSRLASALNDHWRDAAWYAGKDRGGDAARSSPRGLFFRPARYKPFYAIFKDQACEGVQIYIDEDQAENLVEIQFRILAMLGASKLFGQAAADNLSMFDKACGSDEPRKWLASGRDLESLFGRWREDCQRFSEKRKKCLIYE
ncbi:MAG: DUF1343 domain-containing protein [Verrucomicrobiae bacterium]|nr:DUF1343 domain-containing protein [Verrucomicrobiae bacterium]